jgi:hypothetical protein
LQTGIFRSFCDGVDGKGEVGMQGFGNFGLEDQRDIRVGRVDVVGVFMDGLINGVGARLGDDEDVARWLRPL